METWVLPSPTVRIISERTRRLPSGEGASRAETISDMGLYILEALQESEINLPQTGWRVGCLGKQNDRLQNFQHGTEGVATLVEEYTTHTPDGKIGRHVRIYGDPVGDAERPFVPLIIIGDPIAAADMKRREPHLLFSRMRGEDTQISRIERDFLEAASRVGSLEDNDMQWWTLRRASFQLIGVILLNTGDREVRIHVCEDKINNSGYSLLVWPADGEPLGVDSVGKAIWGINITNSPLHRPQSKWIPLDAKD